MSRPRVASWASLHLIFGRLEHIDMSKFVLVSLIALVVAVDLSSTADPISVKWCYTNSIAKTKCEAMVAPLKDAADELNMTVQVACVDGTNAMGCMLKIKNNKADLVVLEDLDIYDAGKGYDLSPIVKEEFKDGKPGCYAVAVVKNSGGSTFELSQLKDKNTCHPGAVSGPGWVIPVGYLMLRAFITPLNCSIFGKVNGFVSAAGKFNQSCVPGVSKFNTSGSIPSNLCKACDSDCSSSGEYSGYDGAFKCLAEGRGDVAFVIETTTQQMVDKGRYGNISDYQYLCSKGGRQAIGTHEDCHIDTCPAPVVMTRSFDKNADAYVKLLLKLSELYGVNQMDPSKFQLFNSTKYGQDDVMFTDTAMGLKETDRFYYEYLKSERFADKADEVTCGIVSTQPPTGGPTPSPTSAVYSVSARVSLLVAMAIVALVGVM